MPVALAVLARHPALVLAQVEGWYDDVHVALTTPQEGSELLRALVGDCALAFALSAYSGESVDVQAGRARERVQPRPRDSVREGLHKGVHQNGVRETHTFETQPPDQQAVFRMVTKFGAPRWIDALT